VSSHSVKRHWLPNIQHKNLWSDILERKVSINVTTTALKYIDAVGGGASGVVLSACRDSKRLHRQPSPGLDNYILHTPDRDLNSAAGLALRRVILEKIDRRRRIEAKYGPGVTEKELRQRFAKEAQAAADARAAAVAAQLR
jgi:ribosomal protein L28